MRRLFFLCALALGLVAHTLPAMASTHGNGPSHLQVAVLAEYAGPLANALSRQLPAPPEAEAIDNPLHPSHPDAHLWAAQVMEALLANVSQLQRAAPDFLQALQADLALAKATEEAICAYSGWNVSQLQRHDWHAELTRHLHPPSPPWLNPLPLVLALLLGVGLLARRHPQARLSAA